MHFRGLFFVVIATWVVYTAAFKGDPSWTPAQGPCFNPPYPPPTYNDIEYAAYWQMRFSLLVYKGKQWEDSGTTTRYSTLMNHPELDAMASQIAANECYQPPATLPPPPPPCSACSEGPFTLVSGITDQLSANIILNANCLFSAPNNFTYNATSFTGNPLSILSPAAFSPEKWLGNPAMGMFSLNILCASGPTVAYVLQYFWDNYQVPLVNPRHNWMGIGIHWVNGTTPTYYISVIMVHMCHPDFPNYDNTTLLSIFDCDDVYAQLSTNAQYLRCGLDYINPLDSYDRRPWLWAGVTTLPQTAPFIYCNGTQTWGGNSITPMPMFFSAPGYPQICPPNPLWKSLEFTGYGFTTCAGGINACLLPQASIN